MNRKDVIDFHICMQSKRVANSINEMEDWPNAEYVVYDAEEDAKKDNQEVLKDELLSVSLVKCL